MAIELNPERSPRAARRAHARPEDDHPQGGGKPTIAILMPMVWGARNVVYSGVLRRLVDAGAEVHLLMPDFDPALFDDPVYSEFTLASSCRRLLRPAVRTRIKGRPLVRDIIHSAFSRRNDIDSYSIYRRWYLRSSSPARRLRSALVESLGWLTQPAALFYGLYRFYDTLYRWEYDLDPVRRQLRAVNPDLIWSTVNIESTYERVYVLAARELGIPVYNSINSFDNLSSKPAHLVYDHYLVWNERMQRELLRFYPQVKEEQVSLTGTPQFDFHVRPECLWQRERTLSELGLLPGDRYFLYTCGTKGLVPGEPGLVAELAQRMQRDEVLGRFRLVVRTHPLDDWSRWEGIEHDSTPVVLSRAWQVRPDEEKWALPPPSDQARLVSSILHAQACINIASTTSLDAAILDRPVIGVRFENEPGAPAEILYEEYDTDHYHPLVESGGLTVAEDWSGLLQAMRAAVRDPGKEREARAQMVAETCGVIDGRAAERAAAELLNGLTAIRAAGSNGK